MKLDPGEYGGTYKVIGGELCFDFANTVSWRNREIPHEWLNSVENLATWCQLVGIFNEVESRQLIKELSISHGTIEKNLSLLQEFREVIFRLFSAIANNETPLKKDIKYLNNFASQRIGARKITYNKKAFFFELESTLTLFDKIIHKVFYSVTHMATHMDLSRANKCKSCEWLFYDKSRNRSRRWCVMEDCGNRNKVNSFNTRQRTFKI